MIEVESAQYQRDYQYIVQAQLDMAMESEGLELDRTVVEKGVKAVFNHPEKGAYYVARSGEEFAGCLLTIPEWSDWRNATCIWIHSVFVPESFRRKGVFSAMYTLLKERVQADESLCGLRLYVEKSNTRAQKVYKKLGMSDEHYDLYEWLSR